MKSRLLAYMCSDDSLTAHAMKEVQAEAWPQEPDRLATLGFGWVQESRTLLRKHPSQAADSVDVLGLLCDIPARSIVGHMRAKNDNDVDTLDLQPFRFRKWVYAQSGEVPCFDEYRAEVVEGIPDHIRRSIQGKTDAEVVFHSFYNHMKQAGALSAGKPRGPRAGEALAETVVEMEQRAREAGHEGPIGVNLVGATERLVVAARLGEPIFYKVFDGVEQPGEDPLFAGHRPKKIQHPHFKGVFVASGLEPKAGEWHELAERELLWIDDSWEPHTLSIDTAQEQ